MNHTSRIHIAAVPAVLVAAGCQGESGTVDDLGPTQGVISAGGLEQPYVVKGKGTPLLVVAGAVYGSRTFRGPILDHFKIYSVDSRVLLPSDSGFDVETITIESLAQEWDGIREVFGFETVAPLGRSMSVADGATHLGWSVPSPHQPLTCTQPSLVDAGVSP